MSERDHFIVGFGALFLVVSDTMAAKCWREIRDVPEPVRAILIKAILLAAKAKSDAQIAASGMISASIGRSIP